MNLVVSDYVGSTSLSKFIGYQKLIGRLIYLFATRHDITIVVHSLSQFIHSPHQAHLKLAL